MYDVERLKQAVDLVALVGRDTTLKKVAAGNGGEFAGACPNCGGRDRLRVQGRGLWTCRQCRDGWGDCISYVRWRDGCSFAEACERLGGLDVPGPGREKAGKRGMKPGHSATLEPSAQPSNAWQARGRAILARARQCLWSDDEALAYLRVDRGLADQTIADAGIGYIPKHAQDRPGAWGLTDGQPVRLWPGWVIPWEVAGVLYGLRIRRRPQDLRPGDDKYIFIRGSRVAGVLYNTDRLGEHGDVILCEGEFDCLLLAQLVGHVAGVATLGSASARPRAEAVATLGRFRRIWLAYDSDKAGQDGLAKIREISRRVRPLRLPADVGNDVTDAHLAGADLCAWVVQGIGPGDLGQRVAWGEHYLSTLYGAAEAGPGLGLWAALLAEYEKSYAVAAGRVALDQVEAA